MSPRIYLSSSLDTHPVILILAIISSTVKFSSRNHSSFSSNDQERLSGWILTLTLPPSSFCLVGQKMHSKVANFELESYSEQTPSRHDIVHINFDSWTLSALSRSKSPWWCFQSCCMKQIMKSFVKKRVMPCFILVLIQNHSVTKLFWPASLGHWDMWEKSHVNNEILHHRSFLEILNSCHWD